MKTKILFLLISLATLSINATIAKATPINTNTTSNSAEKVTGVFDGSDESGYTFILNIEGEGIVFTFNSLEKKVSKLYNLESNDLVGETFEITFEMITNTSEDYNKEELYTITALQVI